VTVYTPAVDDLPQWARKLVRDAQSTGWTVRCVTTDDGSERVLVSVTQGKRHLVALWLAGSFHRAYVSASPAEDFRRAGIKEIVGELTRDPPREYLNAMVLLSAGLGATQPWESVPV
jgi:hypothetical protein